MDQYISESPFKTASMKVNVTNKDEIYVRSYEVPAGFQLERYLESMFPDKVLCVTFPYNEEGKRNFQVKVCNKDYNIIETHTGIYQ